MAPEISNAELDRMLAEMGLSADVGDEMLRSEVVAAQPGLSPISGAVEDWGTYAAHLPTLHNRKVRTSTCTRG